MDCDAVIAESHRTHNRLPRQGAAATSQAIFQTLDPQDRAATTGQMGQGRRLLTGHDPGGHLFVAGRRRHGFGGQTHLLPQPIDDLLQGHPTKTDGRQQVFGAHQIAAPGHPGEGLSIEQGIEAIAAQLPLQHLSAAHNVVLAVAALIPGTDAIAGRGGGDKIEPIQAGMGTL